MSTIAIIIIALASFFFGYFTAKRVTIKAGTIHIDLTDSRKDLVKLELEKDLDEIILHKNVTFRVDEKHEPDFFKGEKYE